MRNVNQINPIEGLITLVALGVVTYSGHHISDAALHKFLFTFVGSSTITSIFLTSTE